MGKTLGSLVPLAIGLAALGGAIAWLLNSGNGLGPWLLAGFLVAHGLVHLLFFVPAPPASGSATTWPFDLGQSWLHRAGLDAAAVRIAGAALVVGVVVFFLLAGLATANLIVPADWWRALVIAAAVLSAVTLVLFFEPQLMLGLAIDGVLLYVVASAAWVPAAAIS